MTVATPRDLVLTRRAKRHGARYSLRIILEARRAGIPISLGFALVEQESNFTNVFGHDASGNHQGAGVVTREKYRAYRRKRGDRGQGGMQGVGPVQLTWYELQDKADKLGGCWIPRHNIRVGFEQLALLIRTHGKREGIARYNGSGLAAKRYAQSVLRKQDVWHRRLAGGA